MRNIPLLIKNLHVRHTFLALTLEALSAFFVFTKDLRRESRGPLEFLMMTENLLSNGRGTSALNDHVGIQFDYWTVEFQT